MRLCVIPLPSTLPSFTHTPFPLAHRSVEKFYLAFYDIGVVAIIYASPPRDPGMGSNAISPFPQHWHANEIPMPFIEIGSVAGEEIKEYLVANPNDNQVHAAFSYDTNPYQSVWDMGGATTFKGIVGIMALLSILKCVSIGLECKMKTKHIVALLSFAPNIITGYFSTHGPFYFDRGFSGTHFLLYGHLFPFSGIASSIFVGNFWGEFTKAWPSVENFIDPVSKKSARRRTLAIIFSCVGIDVGFGETRSEASSGNGCEVMSFCCSLTLNSPPP